MSQMPEFLKLLKALLGGGGLAQPGSVGRRGGIQDLIGPGLPAPPPLLRGRGGKAGGISGVVELPHDLLSAPVDTRRSAFVSSMVLASRWSQALRKKKRGDEPLNDPTVAAPDEGELSPGEF